MKEKILLILMIGFILLIWNVTRENHEYIDIFKEKSIVYKGEALPYQVTLEKDEVYVSTKFIQKFIDESIYVDEATSSIIITTKNKVIQFQENHLKTPVLKKDGEWLLPFSALTDVYPFELLYSKETKLATLIPKGEVIEEADVINKAEVRRGASRKEPIVAYVKEKERVTVLNQSFGWVYIQKENGEVGYVKRKTVSSAWEKTLPWKEEKAFVLPSLKGKKINLVWEAVYSENPDPKTLPAMEGVNIVSPTWFELTNGSGNVKSKADAFYVEWAHQNNKQVWALFSNGFNPDWTHEMLKDYNKRSHVIKQLLNYTELYELDGINLDFENVYGKDKEALVQFVRELTPYFHEQGKVVSMDITIRSTSEMWSMFYDRNRLSEVVDYMALMAYDEHPAASKIAGSVASLPWVESGIKGVLEEVPADKLLLGIPFYTRIWTEEADGIASKTLSMKETKEFLKTHELTPVIDEQTGQNYVEFQDKELKKNRKIWLEDDTSLKKRLQLVENYDLAGIAVWQRSFADDTLWIEIDKMLQKK